MIEKYPRDIYEDYEFVEYTSSGIFEVPSKGDFVLCWILLVAGGGGGGGWSTAAGAGGGGGGAGAWIEKAMLLPAGTSYTVTIGAGGAGGNVNYSGGSGGNSSFGSFLTVGGGGGGSSGSLGTGGLVGARSIYLSDNTDSSPINYIPVIGSTGNGTKPNAAPCYGNGGDRRNIGGYSYPVSYFFKTNIYFGGNSGGINSGGGGGAGLRGKGGDGGGMGDIGTNADGENAGANTGAGGGGGGYTGLQGRGGNGGSGYCLVAYNKMKNKIWSFA